jgi:hypothetical protein
MMCGALAEQQLALGQRLAHQAELVVLQVAQAAVDQLGGRRRGVARQVVLLAQQHGQATAGQVARDAGTVDAAAHHQHVARDRASRAAHGCAPCRRHGRQRSSAESAAARTGPWKLGMWMASAGPHARGARRICSFKFVL